MADGMRSGWLDHYRGFGIILVLFFSLYGWMYSGDAGFFRHNMPNEIHAGDFVFPMFVFASGVSMWHFRRKLRKGWNGFADGAEKFAGLLVAAIIISAFRLFQPYFPDEVALIALSCLIIFPVYFLLGKKGVAGYAAASLIFFAFGKTALGIQAWEMLRIGNLGGWLAAPYYAAILALGALAAEYSLGKNRNAAKGFAHSGIAYAALSVPLLFFFPPFKMENSVSFMMLSASGGAICMAACMRIFEVGRIRLGFVEAMGQKSLSGWAVYYFLTAMVWYLGLLGQFPAWAYIPAVALSIAFACAVAVCLKKTDAGKMKTAPG